MRVSAPGRCLEVSPPPEPGAALPKQGWATWVQKTGLDKVGSCQLPKKECRPLLINFLPPPSCVQLWEIACFTGLPHPNIFLLNTKKTFAFGFGGIFKVDNTAQNPKIQFPNMFLPNHPQNVLKMLAANQYLYPSGPVAS